MLGRSLLLAFILVASSYAETATYLVLRRQYFPDDKYLYEASPQEYKRFIDTGKTTKDLNGNDPVLMTSYVITATGRYAIWTVTDKNPDDKSSIKKLKDDGMIVLISTTEVVTQFIPRTSTYEKRTISCLPLIALPTDFAEILDPSTMTVTTP